MKAIILVDSVTKTVLDIQPTVNSRHDTEVEPQVARRNASDQLSLAEEKGYDKNAFREWLFEHDVRPGIRYCLYDVCTITRTTRGWTMNCTTAAG